MGLPPRRPPPPELRLADLDRDGLDAEIVYGCLMINDLIASGEMRAWADAVYNDWAADFARRADPDRVFPLAIIPNTDPRAAAAEVRRCAKLGLRGGDLAFKGLSVPLYQARRSSCRSLQTGDSSLLFAPITARTGWVIRLAFSRGVEPGPPLTVRTQKAQALLAYLALPPGQAHRRDKLAALLWGEMRDEQARTSLRSCAAERQAPAFSIPSGAPRSGHVLGEKVIDERLVT